jgi:hypothetical protein
MQLCIFYLLTVRRQENKVFSAAFAAENTSFPAGPPQRRIEKKLNEQRKKVFPHYYVYPAMML